MTSSSKENTRYIGITIGPIYKTIIKARATRELWAASYLFSYLMHSIIQELEKQGLKPLIPYVDENKMQAVEAGLIPDRLIVQVNEGQLGRIDSIIKCVKLNFAKELGNHIKIEQARINLFINSYFKVYAVEMPVENNPILKISPYLDSAELQETYIPENPDNLDVLGAFFEKIKFKRSTLRKIFNCKPPKISSIEEITTRSLRKLDVQFYDMLQKDEGSVIEDTFVKGLKETLKGTDKFKTYHKYVAIVHADGDSIGKTIEKLGSDSAKIQAFSKELFDFAYESVKMIQDYGGLPVYAGGDDLLFFAPILCNEVEVTAGHKGNTLFHLLEKLDKNFTQKFTELSKDVERKPTLSFGVSISYYKYPMNEAVEASYGLLMDAKKYPDENHATKNAIAVKVLKHSGQSFKHVFGLQKPLFELFRTLLAEIGGEKSTINSMIYALGRNRKVLNMIGTDERKVRNLIENSFDEDIHKEVDDFLQKVVQLIVESYQEFGSPADLSEEGTALQTVYSILRTINFLKRKDNE